MDGRTQGGKKNKRRIQKPRQRSSQSLLGKVATRVKGFLGLSWLSQWVSGEQPEEFSDEEGSSGEENVVVSHGSKRLRLEIDSPSSITAGTQTWLHGSSTSTISCNDLIVNKEHAAVSEDNHSENSEGSASTSGCSSLVSHKERSSAEMNLSSTNKDYSSFTYLAKNSAGFKFRKDITAFQKKQDTSGNTSKLSLWSESVINSPANRLAQRSPSISFSNQASFKVGAFVGSPKPHLYNTSSRVMSPSYHSKTYDHPIRRMPASVTPYQTQMNIRNQIKVQAAQCVDTIEGMSTASRRVMEALDKMTSPPVNTSRHRTLTTTKSVGVKRGPPIADISALSKLTTIQNKHRHTSSMMSPSERQHLWAGGDLIDRGKATTSCLDSDSADKWKSSQSCTPKNIDEPEPVPLSSNLPLFAFNPISQETDEPNAISSDPKIFSKMDTIESLHKISESPTKTDGSILSKAKTTFQFSKPVEEKSSNITLLSNTSPTTWKCSSCWIQNLSIQSKCMACETPKESDNGQKSSKLNFGVTSSSSTVSFSFAPPKTSDFKIPGEAATTSFGQTFNNTGKFNFSSPITVDVVEKLIKSTTTTTATSFGDLPLNTTIGSTSKFNFTSPVTFNAGQKLLDSTSTTAPVFGGSQITTSSSLTSECNSSAPCKTSLLKQQFLPIVLTTKENSFSTEENTKLIKEKSSSSVSQTPTDSDKPSSKGMTVPDVEKVPPVSSGTAPAKSLSDFCASPGLWECDTCLVRNKANDQVCIACETPKKGAVSQAKSFDASSTMQIGLTNGGFKFTAPSNAGSFGGVSLSTTKNENKSEFKNTDVTGSQAEPLSKDVKIGSGFKFSVPDSQMNKEPAPSFVFGSTSASKTQKKSEDAPAFTFAAPSFVVGSPIPGSLETGERSPTGSKTSFVFGTPSNSEKRDEPAFTFSPPIVHSVQQNSMFSFGEASFTKPLQEGKENKLVAVAASLFSSKQEKVDTSGNFKLSSGLAAPGEWECDTCCVRNASHLQKCAACETIKSSNGSASSNGSSLIQPFKFVSPKSNISPPAFGTQSSITSTQSPQVGHSNFNLPLSKSTPASDSSSNQQNKIKDNQTRSENKHLSLNQNKAITSSSIFGNSTPSAQISNSSLPILKSVDSTEKPSSDTQSPMFSFGGTSEDITEKKEENKTLASVFSTTAKPFAFSQAPAASSSFFVATTAASSKQPSAPTAQFTFGSTAKTSPATEPTDSSSMFKFGATSTPVATNGFTFGSPKSTCNGFSFGSTTPMATSAGLQSSSQVTAPVFSFGSSSVSTNPLQASTPSFSFGSAPSAPSVFSAPNNMTFGNGAGKSAFGFGTNTPLGSSTTSSVDQSISNFSQSSNPFTNRSNPFQLAAKSSSSSKSTSGRRIRKAVRKM